MGFEGHTRGMWNYGFLTLSSLARGTDILVSGLGRLYFLGATSHRLEAFPLLCVVIMFL